MGTPIANREYDEGDVVRITATLKVSGVLTDPGTLRFKYKNPAGTITTKVYGTDVDLVKDSVGTFHFDLTLSTQGTWWYRWESTGTAAGAKERRIQVRPSEFV